MPSQTVPSKTTVLVMGGGPGGSYAATVLARNGVDVTILEAVQHPRYHVGESLLASCNYFLEYIDARNKVLAHGFIKKPGGAFKLGKNFPVAYTNFVDRQGRNHSFNVNRSEFDDLLFRHAGSQGARLFDQHKVTELLFSETEPSRPVAAKWESKAMQTSGTIAFDYLIDASGRHGVLSTKYHKDRRMTQSLKNSAVWGYWKGSKLYGEGTDRYGAPMLEALEDNTGWCWYIPVNDGTISVGICMHDEFVKRKKAGKTLEEFYLDQFQYLTEVTGLRGDGVLAPHKEGNECPIYMASDYSYLADDVGKLNYRLVGDAAAFIDPFFSSGVHLAITGALSAALSILSLIDGACDEQTSAKFHEDELKAAYTRFFLIVLAGYKQMRGGVNANVLNDIGETDFSRAFDIIRPVIQGTGDIGVDRGATGDRKLTENELSSAVDFVFRLFKHNPDDPDHDERLEGNYFGLDKDARARLEELSSYIPQMRNFAGIRHMLDSAKERMKLSLLDGKPLTTPVPT